MTVVLWIVGLVLYGGVAVLVGRLCRHVGSQPTPPAAQALDAAWTAVHVRRFGAIHDPAGHPDYFYVGVIEAEGAIDELSRRLTGVTARCRVHHSQPCERCGR